MSQAGSQAPPAPPLHPRPAKKPATTPPPATPAPASGPVVLRFSNGNELSAALAQMQKNVGGMLTCGLKAGGFFEGALVEASNTGVLLRIPSGETVRLDPRKDLISCTLTPKATQSAWR